MEGTVVRRIVAHLERHDRPVAPVLAAAGLTEADLEEVQRLRFRVFNLELGEGLAESVASGAMRVSNRGVSASVKIGALLPIGSFATLPYVLPAVPA